MERSKMVLLGALLGTAVGLGVAVGYALVTNEDLRRRITGNVKGLYESSRARVSEMSEEAAMRTARITKNPKINQDWVAQQWESLGL